MSSDNFDKLVRAVNPYIDAAYHFYRPLRVHRKILNAGRL
jgi:hypothetical protein